MESYMTRDDSGEGSYETQRRQSPRSLYSVTSSGSSQLSLVSPLSVKSTKSSIRFVNSAAFIENDDDDEEAPADSSSPFEGFSERNFVTHRVSPTDLVPPLNLSLHDDNQSKDNSYSYRKNCLAAKVKPDEAYQTWLEAKRKLLADQARRRLKEQEEKQRREEERKQMAEQKFKEWYARKAHEVSRRASVPDKSPPVSRPVAKTHRSRSLSDEEARAKLEEWNRRKVAEEERRRLMKLREEEQRRAYEQQRQQAAQEAWQKWLAESRQKPKPVPLGCGINTLRGTVSDIFVNPNEWVAVFSDEDD